MLYVFVCRKFGVAVELGCGKGFVSRNVYSDMVDTLYQCELSAKTLVMFSGYHVASWCGCVYVDVCVCVCVGV